MVTAIILAAGKGKRVNAGTNKMFISLRNKPVLAYSLDAFESCSEIENIILVASEEEHSSCERIISSYGYKKVKGIVNGGKERQDSVFNALMAIPEACEVVVIHDGARPMIRPATIAICIAEARLWGASSAGMPVKDTVKIVAPSGRVSYTPDRRNIWITQTPQAFKLEIIKDSHLKAKEASYAGTDDAVLAERAGYAVKMVEADYENIKITTPEDISVAEAILDKRDTKNGDNVTV